MDEILTVAGRRVAKNTTALIIGIVFLKFCTLAFYIIAARYVGAAGFGKYTFALSFAALFMILGDIGLDTLAIREVAKDKSLINKYLGNMLILRMILSVVAMGIIFLVIYLLNPPKETVVVTCIIGVAAFFVSISAALRWCFRAFQKMEYEMAVNLVEGSLLLGFGFLALKLGKGVVGLAEAYLATYVIIFVVCFFIIINKFVNPKFEINFKFYKYLILAAVPLGLIAIFNTISINVDTVLLSFLKGDQQVGWYNAGAKLVNFIKFLPAVFTWAMFPAMSEFHKVSQDLLRRIFKKAFQYTLTLILPIGVGVTILAPQISIFIWGSGFNRSIPILQILIWSVVLFSIGNLVIYYLIAVNKQKVSTLILGLFLVVKIILNFILISLFSYVGAAVAVVLSEFFLTLMALFFIFLKLRINPFPESVFKILAATLSMALFTWFIRDFNVFIVIILSAIFYFVILILIKGMSKSDLELAKKIVRL